MQPELTLEEKIAAAPYPGMEREIARAEALPPTPPKEAAPVKAAKQQSKAKADLEKMALDRFPDSAESKLIKGEAATTRELVKRRDWTKLNTQKAGASQPYRQYVANLINAELDKRAQAGEKF